MYYLAFENEMETWPILKNNLDTFYTFLLHIFWNKCKNFILSFYCCGECFWFHVIYAFMCIRSDWDRMRVWICDIKWGDGVKVWVLFLSDKYLNCLLNEDFFNEDWNVNLGWVSVIKWKIHYRNLLRSKYWNLHFLGQEFVENGYKHLTVNFLWQRG